VWGSAVRRGDLGPPPAGRREMPPQRMALPHPSKIDGRQHFRGLLIGGPADGRQAFQAGHVGAAFTLALRQEGKCEAFGALFANVPSVGFSTYGEAYTRCGLRTNGSPPTIRPTGLRMKRAGTSVLPMPRACSYASRESFSFGGGNRTNG